MGCLHHGITHPSKDDMARPPQLASDTGWPAPSGQCMTSRVKSVFSQDWKSAARIEPGAHCVLLIRSNDQEYFGSMSSDDEEFLNEICDILKAHIGEPISRNWKASIFPRTRPRPNPYIFPHEAETRSGDINRPLAGPWDFQLQ
jgi:hypothetical protein